MSVSRRRTPGPGVEMWTTAPGPGVEGGTAPAVAYADELLAMLRGVVLAMGADIVDVDGP